MDYDRTILHYLIEAGEKGIAVNKLSKHVYNASNTFFNSIRYEEVHQYVATYLTKNSKDTASLIEKTGQRGHYRINLQSKETRQLMLEFTENDRQDNVVTQQEDSSLTLF